MGLNSSGAADQAIDLGDISTARFEDLVAWTFLSFFRVETTAGDDRCIVGKWASAAEQFIIRVDGGTAPQEIQVFTNDAQRITGGNNVALNTWYLVALSNDGGGGATAMAFSLIEMDGTFLDDELTGDHAGDSGLTATVFLGKRENGQDRMDGDIALTTYVDAALSKQDKLNYLRTPHRMVAKWIGQHGVQYFIPGGLSDPEVDLSGSGITANRDGSPTVGDNPPVGLWYGADVVSGGGAAAAVAVGIRNPFGGPMVLRNPLGA